MAVEEIQNAYIILDEVGIGPKPRLNFQLMPDSISDYKTANWGDINVIGRAEPYRVYANSTPRTFAFSLKFIASTSQGDAGVIAEVKNKVHFLQSLVYPTENAGIVDHPPVIFLIIGDFISSRCIAKTYNTRWSGPWETVSSENANNDPSSGLLDLIPRKIGFSAAPLPVSFSIPFAGSSAAEDAGGPLVLGNPYVAETHIVFEEIINIPHNSKQVRDGRVFL